MHFSATYQLRENSSFGNLKPFLDKKIHSTLPVHVRNLKCQKFYKVTPFDGTQNAVPLGLDGNNFCALLVLICI